MTVMQWIGIIVAWHIGIGLIVAIIFAETTTWNGKWENKILTKRGIFLLWLIIPVFGIIRVLWAIGAWFFVKDDLY